jgi:2-keto-myo-inositol isomerase
VGYEGYKIVFDTFHHAIGPDNLEKFSDEYDVKLTGIIHISAVTADLSPEEYRDEHRNIDFLNDKMKSKEQIEYFVKRGYDSIISFEPFSRDLQELDKEELKNRINMAIKHLIPEITV